MTVGCFQGIIVGMWIFPWHADTAHTLHWLQHTDTKKVPIRVLLLKNTHHIDMFYHSGLSFSIASYLAEWWRVVRCQLDGWDVQFEPRRFFSLQAAGPASCLIHACCLLLNLPAGQQMILKINHMLTDT